MSTDERERSHIQWLQHRAHRVQPALGFEGGNVGIPVELDQIAKRQAARKAELNAEAPLKKLVLAAQREGLVEWDYWDDRAYPPSIIYPSFDVEPDPYEGDHTVGSWQEAAALVETYRRLREDLKQAA